MTPVAGSAIAHPRSAVGPATTGWVFDVQRFSLHDGPGIRTTVFLGGCPLACPWCQNPEGRAGAAQLLFHAHRCTACGACAVVCPVGVHGLTAGGHRVDRSRCTACGACVDACSTGALELAGRRRTAAEILDEVAADLPYYQDSGGGMTLSGGEPLAQPAFAAALLAAAKERGIATAIETSLAVEREALDAVLPGCDLVLADLKHADAARLRAATGADAGRVWANLVVAGQRVPVVLRTPVIPGFNDTEEDIGAIAALVRALPGVHAWELLPGNRFGEAKRRALGLEPTGGGGEPSRDRLECLRTVAAQHAPCPVRLVGYGHRQPPEVFAPPTPAALVAGEDLDLAARLAALRATKARHTAAKRAEGPRDTDDWGQIPLEGRPFAFRPETDGHGRVLGPRACGTNFARFLAACPTWVDPMSSLLGGYFVIFNGFVSGWDLDDFWTDLQPTFARYGVVHGIDNSQHFTPDVAIGLELGFGGLQAKVARFRPVNRNEEAQAYYDGLTAWLRGVQDWIARHVAAAETQAADETHPQLADTLLAQAAMNRRLIDEPPQTFREALQWLAWYQMAKRSYIGGGSLGRLDVLLRPFYERDLATGATDAETAVFDLACFLLKDSHYIQLGGVDAEGRDVTNPLSFLFLEAAHRLGIPANLAVVVHEGMDPAFLRRAVELLAVDRTGCPRFYGLESNVAGLLGQGFTLAQARERTQSGCHWACLPGREYCFSDTIKLNLPKVLLAALDDVMAGPAADRSVAALWQRYAHHLDRALAAVAAGIDRHVDRQHRYYPELALSLCCHGPVERGIDASHGGVEIVNVGVDAAGLATVADSIAAIEQRVEREGAVGWDALYGALGLGWWLAGDVRRKMRSVPGYGRGGTAADGWAERISADFTARVVAAPTPAGHWMSPGLFSWASTIAMGRETPATPDGRGTGEPLSFGANPNPGRERGRLLPTAVSTAIAAVQPGRGNAAPFQFDVDVGVVDEEAIRAIASVIRTHFRLGGTLVNANILDRQRLLDACRHPDRHPDLIVRVTGFSAYFASLSDEFRQLVFRRVVGGDGEDPAADHPTDHPPGCPA